jgi:Tol biopolymer transport system component
LFVMAGTVLALSANPAAAGAAATTRVSVSSTGAQTDSYSVGHTLSADGRYVAFGSGASTLVPNDTNGVDDVFVRDLRTRTTTLISVSGAGVQGDHNSFTPSISATGRYVAFVSNARTLVPGSAAAGGPDVFVRDRVAGTTTAITRTITGAPADGGSADPAISGDGRYVTFSSYATNLVPDDTNGVRDVFVHDLQTQATTRASLSTGGRQGDGTSIEPAINRNGRYVTYYSQAANLVAGDTNETIDVFVRDVRAGTTTRVSVSSTGAQSNGWGDYTPDISADGRRITFVSNANNLVAGDTNGTSDAFLRDLVTGTTTLVSLAGSGEQANAGSENPVISADGQHIAFTGHANNLVAADTNETPDVFVRDLQAGTTTRVSTSGTGSQGDNGSFSAAISAHGDRVAFVSHATNLVRGDTNGQPDVFAHVRG